MHKYWGKKPANDLSGLIEKYSKKGDTLLDPFSGYGVFCCEAYLLGRNVISNDLNPTANFITNQLLNKQIDLNKLQIQWKKIRADFEPFIKEWYHYTFEGESVIPSAVLRDKNDVPIMFKFKRQGDKKSLEISIPKEEAEQYLKFEKEHTISDWFPNDLLIENSRISAKKGMKISDLFTKRTLACHARLLALINKYSNGKEMELFKLAFTANLANCSRLVPPIKSRGPMAPGAWMTGFYTGETYLENNVLQYFENRFKKTVKGKKEFLELVAPTDRRIIFKPNNATYRITNEDAKCLSINSESVDYVFTDPPYGEAVPYFEQSIIWNSWLKFSPDYENEIVITDSKQRKKGVFEFENEIYLAFKEISRVLKPNGLFSLTYHSLSGLEWKAITNACIKNNFKLVDFTWLVQKAFTPRQINRLKTIKGDVLVTLKKKELIDPIILSDQEIERRFKQKISNWLSKEPLDTNEIFLRIMKMIFDERWVIGNVDLLKILTNNFNFSDDKKWT